MMHPCRNSPLPPVCPLPRLPPSLPHSFSPVFSPNSIPTACPISSYTQLAVILYAHLSQTWIGTRTTYLWSLEGKLATSHSGLVGMKTPLRSTSTPPVCVFFFFCFSFFFSFLSFLIFSFFFFSYISYPILIVNTACYCLI